VKEEVFDKLGLENTMMIPPLIYQSNEACAPTENDTKWRS